MIVQFFVVFKDYLIEVLPFLASGKTLFIYLVVISIMALVLGWGFSLT